MPLKLIATPDFETTVHVATAHTTGSFRARFVAKRSSELREMSERYAQAGDAQGLLMDVCTWFEPVELPDGSTLEHTGADSLRQLLDWPGIGPAMSLHYHRALWEEARGNSRQPPAGS
jgi:hypothetical protein